MASTDLVITMVFSDAVEQKPALAGIFVPMEAGGSSNKIKQTGKPEEEIAQKLRRQQPRLGRL